MNYLLLILGELLILWFISAKLTSKLAGSLPTVLYAIFFAPGTFIHELSHFLMAKILYVRVGHFSIVPRKSDQEIVLGSVAIAKVDIFRRFLIGLAPVIFGAVTVLELIFLISQHNLHSDWRLAIILGYTIFVIVNSMFSSKRDLEGAWKVILIILVFIFIFWVLGIRLNISVDSKLLETFSGYLLVPIVIDALILIFLTHGRRT